MAELYATSSDVTAYNTEQGSPYTLPASGDLTKLIEAAQFDLDDVLGNYAIYDSGTPAGHKLDPSVDLTYSEAQALRRATCAQALYRIEMTPEFFTRPRFASTSGPEFSTEGRAPVVGPLAMRELSGSGLIRNTVALGAERRAPRWLSFVRNIEP